uniref:zinc finger protein 462-like n=1 Tax=Scatophagus argus TaxID=75038 RepID=UPI001ED7DE3D|nr:zinc finger protein 462-like [Scatophagus argus]
MQKDSVNFSTTGHLISNQAVTQESQIKSVQCSHCTLIFKSKVCLSQHLTKEHGFDEDVALQVAGFRACGTNEASTDKHSNSSGNYFECQHCDFKACSQDVLNKHEKQCLIKPDNRDVIGALIISENPETNQDKEAAGAKEISSVFSVKPSSKTKCTLNSHKDLKTYKKPLQTITKYFEASSGLKEEPTVKLDDIPVALDSTKGTLILEKSHLDSSPNSSGVFKVTAKPTIDMSNRVSDCFLLDNHLLVTDLTPPNPKEQFKETVPNKARKRINKESTKTFCAKKTKLDKEETGLRESANAQTQQSSNSAAVSYEFSDDEEEKKAYLVNGNAESPEVYLCKHCDYSDGSIRRVSTHYQNDHPYIRYNTGYIQDPSDQSATFRCLECPVEFFSVADLKKHYTENHPDALNVFGMQSNELCLVFKCFVCQFTSNALKDLKEHYKEKHPTHEVDNSLMYCRYSVTRCQEEPSQLNTCEKVITLEMPQEISHEGTSTPCKEVKNVPSPQHPTSSGADVVLYHCNNCKFSHKSVVVMHVHYQKSHPDEAVTIDKIKQSAQVMSHTTLQSTPDKSISSVPRIEKSTPQKNISNSSKETRNTVVLSKQKKISFSLQNPKSTAKASKMHSQSDETKKVESFEDRRKGKKSPTKHTREVFTGMDSLSCISPNALFYCQFCSYSNSNIKSVVGHHNAKHAADGPTDSLNILRYSAEVQKKKFKSDAEASVRTTSTDEEGIADALGMKYNPYACAENLFYCEKCNYGNPSVQGVINHQCKVHHDIKTNMESVNEYTALIRDEIKKSKSQAKELSFSSHLPLPLMNEGDENAFFCQFCNYRNPNMNLVLRHCVKQHSGFEFKSEQIRRYTSIVLSQTKKSHLKTAASQEVNQAPLRIKGNKKKKTKMFGNVSAPPSIRASQTQRALQCHRCRYSTQYVYLLRRHMWKIHRSNRSAPDILKMYFKRGTLQAGYHCDLCVSFHEKAADLYEHFQEQHPGRKLSLEYVSTRLYVGPDTCSSKKKKDQIKHTLDSSNGDSTGGSLLSERSGQNEIRKYSCRACSFKASSLSGMTRHCRAVHPWSVKENGSVLYLLNSKKQNANRQVEDQNEESFDISQAPLEFEQSPGSSNQAVSSKKLKCPFCPGRFLTQHGLNTHCGMKHQEDVTKNSHKQLEEQVQIQARVHVFRCPHCTYVNTNYQGVLTHCQMRHPDLASRADSIFIEESHSQNWEDCVKRKGSDLRLCGYMCKTCPQIYASPEKLKKHCQEEHNEMMESTVTSKASSISKKKRHKIHSNQGSVSKASFLRKKIYSVIRCQYCSYTCTTKLALGQHLQVHNKSASLSTAQDCFYKCALCSSFYFSKKRLGNHYATKHGKAAFLKYYVPLYKWVHKNPVPDCSLTQQPENASEECKSSMTTKENQKLVYKCPSCPYVNASYHGTLTHCQMRHPDLVARADELQTREILVSNMVGCTLGRSSNVRGYMCKKCPQIHVSSKNLKIHCEREHNRAEATASERSDEIETENETEHSSRSSVLEAVSLKTKTSVVSTTEAGFSHQLGIPGTCQPSTLSVQDKTSLYKCHICPYRGSCRKYLYCHYKHTHKLDSFTTCKLLQRYNKYKNTKARILPEAESEQSAHVKCKMCPDLVFDSSQLLIAHYSTFHSTGCIQDFIVLSQASKKTTGLYRCALCNKQMNGIRKLCHHLENHRERERKMARATKAITTTREATSIELCKQDELPMLETVEELAQWNVTPVETFTVPPSPPSSPSKSADLEPSELNSREDKLTCKQCARTFMSLKGLRSHERSHAALAAIKKLNTTSALKHNINKYILYKAGTLRPFMCSFCSYRTTVMGLWRSHFMKKHKDVLTDAAETNNRDEESTQRAVEDPLYSSEELNHLPELDEEPEIAEKSLYLEPPDVQRQLNHYNLMAQAGAQSKTNVEENNLPDNSLLYCEVCNFSTGHLSSMRRHYLNRHGKKILRCKDCDFFTGLRKTLEMHMEAGHSTCQSGPTHQKDLRCPFCLYQTKSKNNMIDHIVLHRDERVVPVEVCRSKLSRYLQGIVFRCHKCTFTSGSAENLRLHMMKHNEIKPYKCRLCYFDCTQLSDLEAHLTDKHQVLRNHELVGQISLDQLETRVGRMQQEESMTSDMQRHDNDSEDVKTEEFILDCNEEPHVAQANIVQIEDSYCNEGQNGNQKIPAKCCLIDLQQENIKPNTTVEEKQEQDRQEHAETVLSPDTPRGEEIENKAEQKIDKGNNTSVQYEYCSYPEKDMQTNKNQTQPKIKDSEDNILTFTQLNESAEGSSVTFGKIAEETQAHKLPIKALKHRTLNIEAKIEDDILRHVLWLDEDGSMQKIQKKSGQDRPIKTEQSTEPEVVNNVLNELLSLDKEGSITSAHNQNDQDHTEQISTPAKTNHKQASNIRTQEHFTVQRYLLTLGPSCKELEINHKGILGVSFTNCKEKQVQNPKSSEEVRDTYGEMPFLENECLKEEMNPLSCCKEEDQNLEQQQDREGETIAEDDKNRRAHPEHQEGDEMKEDENLHVPKGALTVMDGAGTEENLFVCEFCGRNLMNSSELQRHIIRHGI